MASTVGLRCGHGLQLLDAASVPPEHGPWAFWPNPDIELGDLMSCIVCGSAHEVTAVYGELIPIQDNGKLVIP